ncbi:MAG TPA: hydantoinase/oxoprolinase family protein [Candidatus Baltobacteraceae bacterium]|nr:hydantoinase/oxoprolinase family protein [Candidatus Baltobacteraceae bacterium]
MAKLRLGVDVGGTFTDVVAIDSSTRALVARVKVPTTHDAPEGVAAGIVEGIRSVLASGNVDPVDVAFIAHSTTQATNALLEGDIARVGVIGLTRHFAWLARVQMRFGPVALAPGITFAPEVAFARNGDANDLDGILTRFTQGGVEAVAVSEPFGVDRPESEQRAADAARARGLFATGGHDVSALYGLRARTRTAAINAAILPKMLRTSRMTAQAVTRAGITAPLMIMRSDGGVMDVSEIETRPILTMLSGPAAGVAGALLYENVTDAIFIEVGGTSSDLCAIRGGVPQMRPARIGGHRTMLRTIDSRTLGIAGGSMPRVDAHGVTDIGPRSAHIAGCAYASFLSREDFEGARVERFAPSAHDPPDYLRFVLRDGTHATLTVTCASNLLGYVPAGSFAHGNAGAVRAAFDLLAAEVGGDAEQIARAMLEIAARKVEAGVEELIADYALDRETLELVGGGGGAGALVPFVARALGMEHRIARDAEVISPIGVALALVRDVVERTIVDPTPEDIARIRREVTDRVIAAGAAPEKIAVSIEIDAQRNRVRATASGATAMAESSAAAVASEDERCAAAARSMRVEASAPHEVGRTAAMRLYRAGRDIRVVDERAVVRLALRDAQLERSTAGGLESAMSAAIEAATAFGDVGRSLPAVYVIHGGRIVDLRGLAKADQALALAKEEIAGSDADDPIVLLTVATAA